MKKIIIIAMFFSFSLCALAEKIGSLSTSPAAETSNVFVQSTQKIDVKSTYYVIRQGKIICQLKPITIVKGMGGVMKIDPTTAVKDVNKGDDVFDKPESPAPTPAPAISPASAPSPAPTPVAKPTLTERELAIDKPEVKAPAPAPTQSSPSTPPQKSLKDSPFSNINDPSVKSESSEPAIQGVESNQGVPPLLE